MSTAQTVGYIVSFSPSLSTPVLIRPPGPFPVQFRSGIIWPSCVCPVGGWVCTACSHRADDNITRLETWPAGESNHVERSRQQAQQPDYQIVTGEEIGRKGGGGLTSARYREIYYRRMQTLGQFIPNEINSFISMKKKNDNFSKFRLKFGGESPSRLRLSSAPSINTYLSVSYSAEILWIAALYI